jgi:hypothetical protein
MSQCLVRVEWYAKYAKCQVRYGQVEHEQVVRSAHVSVQQHGRYDEYVAKKAQYDDGEKYKYEQFLFVSVQLAV